jgi:hypothetical protein
VHREPDLVTLLPREVEELGENLQSWCVEHLFPSNGWDLHSATLAWGTGYSLWGA